MEFAEATCKQLVTYGGGAGVEELDSIAEGAELLSPLVDDLVSEMPAPMSTCQVSELVGWKTFCRSCSHDATSLREI